MISLSGSYLTEMRAVLLHIKLNVTTISYLVQMLLPSTKRPHRVQCGHYLGGEPPRRVENHGRRGLVIDGAAVEHALVGVLEAGEKN